MEEVSVRSADMLAGSGAEHVRLVSLGGFCGPKLAFQKMGRGAETLPFDWLRTRAEGILQFLRTDFHGFFQWDSKSELGRMTTYRSRYHTFCHDDPEDAGMRERYTRRIKRFWEIDANTSPVLFVRVLVSTDELALVEDMLAELQLRFGPQAYLLVLIDNQTARRAMIGQNSNLLIYCVKQALCMGGSEPFFQPVKDALDWIIRKPLEVEKFPSVDALSRVLAFSPLMAFHYSSAA